MQRQDCTACSGPYENFVGPTCTAALHMKTKGKNPGMHSEITTEHIGTYCTIDDHLYM